MKTIGDAVMAAFSRPTDAVSAALHILGEIEHYNAEHGDPSIILKIGAHCGPSITVTLNENLDYFGQTVNVAARVQSLADAGAICLSEALYSAPGVSQLLTGLRSSGSMPLSEVLKETRACIAWYPARRCCHRDNRLTRPMHAQCESVHA